MPRTPPTSDVLPPHLELRGAIFSWRGPAPHPFVAVQRAEQLDVGDVVTIRLTVEASER